MLCQLPPNVNSQLLFILTSHDVSKTPLNIIFFTQIQNHLRIGTMKVFLVFCVLRTVNTSPFYPPHESNFSDALPSTEDPVVWYDCLGTIPNYETLFTICNWQMVGSKGSDCHIASPKCSYRPNFCGYLVRKEKNTFELDKSCFFLTRCLLPATYPS